MNKHFFAAALLASCGPSQSLQHPSGEAGTAVSSAPVHPLALELTAVTARGDVEVRDESGWKPLVEGRSLAGVTEIKAVRRGAMLSIGHGDAGGRLWLRAGSHVKIGQNASGVHVAVVEGRARVRRTDAALPLFIDDRAIDGDVIAMQGGVTPTAARPEMAAWSMGLEHDEVGAGVGRMEAASAAGAMEALELRKVSVRVRTEGDMAITEVEHVFHNPADGRPREGTFRFPVPDGAMLVGMAMEIDGKLVEGEIVEREKARQVYDSVVDSMQDPALLEWEAGNWFKLRVFPLAANADKRVIIRYAAPLSRGPNGYEYNYDLAITDRSAGGAAPGLVGELTVDVDGKRVAHETKLGGIELAVPVKMAPVVMRENHKDATYTAVRIAPDASMMSTGAKGPKNVAIVFDTSRSSLEGRALADQLLATTLAELAPEDHFVVLASDVSVTPSSKELEPVTADSITQAKKFLAGIEPDGASDLGAALQAAAAVHPNEVIYIGDGVPTWGEQQPGALGTLADKLGAPIHAALIGKGATTSLWGDLAGRTGGRAIMVRKADDAARFALVASHAGDIPRLVDSHVVVAGDAQVFPLQAMTIFQGDEMVALIRTPAGKSPSSVTLTGTRNGKPVSKEIKLAAAVDEPGVAQRFGADLIAQMESSDAERDTIVATSRDFGVLSKFTSLLVLENDEAYKKYDIERKQAEVQAKNGNPQITGGDLDTLGSRQASLSPDEIQPGDPEIKIPAPADAKEVLVTFPFGETKRAVWDPDLDAWMVRFLIDKDTPDGNYSAHVTVTHADGHIQLLTLGYVVDTHAPTIQLTAIRVANGYKISAKQIADGSAHRNDADKVEVQLPDGTILALTESKWGKFEGLWRTEALSSPVTLRVVVRDRALNEGTQDLVVGGAK
ncbi:MAG TPA: VIT and VWA domain-containing protein [Kofleriaceae bacterium]|nr:VIT and VWA domain-containing protein [Kofleriaceae bacterium]